MTLKMIDITISVEKVALKHQAQNVQVFHVEREMQDNLQTLGRELGLRSGLRSDLVQRFRIDFLNGSKPLQWHQTQVH